ncbi:MAG: hypothetical protein AB1750_03045 [Chloroflexota bacterium]
MKTTPSFSRRFIVFFLCLALVSGLACTVTLFELPKSSTLTPPTPSGPTATPLPATQVTFRVSLPTTLLPGETLALRVLDEVTGLAFNYTDHTMAARDPLNYSVTVEVPNNSTLKYKYVRLGGPGTPEYNSFNQPLRYRLFFSSGATEVTDTVAAWPDRPFAAAIGAIQGAVVNQETGVPVANLLVTAGGIQSITDSAGRFNLQGLPVGTHNVVAYAMDGSYDTFQQGATVAASLTTPVSVNVKAAPLVPVTWNVTVPENTPEGAPLRIAGNLIQLGNTFADLRGGLSVIASRMPSMNATGTRTFSYTLNLPAGADIRYKYTLGDGLWNAEHTAAGAFVTRQVIVPQGGIVIEDTVETWLAGQSAPITFEVAIPPDTPAGETIYIQFNPYGWTEPLPMWYAHDDTWRFKLFGPLNLDTVYYRYCRNAQCGVADDASTAGDSAAGRRTETALTPQTLRDKVSSWTWTTPFSTTLVGANVIPRSGGFMAGIEFQAYYDPYWLSFTDQAMQNVKEIGSNWVVLTPSWTYSSANPLVFGVVPGPDPLSADTEIMVTQARVRNLNVALFPQPRFPGQADDASTSLSASWWRAAPRDSTWWQLWFDYYREFAINYADMATRSGAQAVILGGDWIAPALPGGTLSDGTASNVPADAEARWQTIVNEIRARFRGQIFWAMPYTVPNLQTPPFIKTTDGIYLMISDSLSESASPTRDELTQAAASLLDNGVGPLQSLIGKPIYLAFAYPSATGATRKCLPASSSSCLTWTALSLPNDLPEIALNLQLQADIYESLFAAVNTRPWVSGVVARGYYPPALLQDKSASTHGKPAQDVLWYWYQRFLGIVR